MTRFLFDLDGTLTEVESLRHLARRAGLLTPEFDTMTGRAVEGTDRYEANLRERIRRLGCIPADLARRYIGEVKLRSQLCDFILARKNMCGVVSSNLDCWWGERLQRELGCDIHLSKSAIERGKISLASVTDKCAVVSSYRRAGHEVVFIGDGSNDVAASACADTAIAVAFDHPPCAALAEVADIIVTSEYELTEILMRLCADASRLSRV